TAFACLVVRRRFSGSIDAVGPMDDPDVIVGVDAETDRLAQIPMIRQRLGEQRVDFEPGRHHGAFGLRGRFFLERTLRDAERADERDEDQPDVQIPPALHSPAPQWPAAVPWLMNFWTRFPSKFSPVYTLPLESTATLPSP